MAYITPNSDIYILKNVPFDRSYNHTVKWTNATEQFTALTSNNYKAFQLTSQSYQRWKRGYIRVDKSCDELYGCNYLMFRNTEYGSKWFYAFLDEPEYINNNCSQLHYTIDVMQTWQFNIDVPACFVEREHSLYDDIGDNIVPEDFNVDDYVTWNYNELDLSLLMCSIITSKPFPTQNGWINLVDFTSQQSGFYYLAQSYHPLQRGEYADSLSGVPSGVYIYSGLPLCNKDVNEYIANNYNSYAYMQDYHCYSTQSFSSIDDFGTRNFPLTAERLIYFMANYISAGGSFSADDILGVYVYPALFENTQLTTQATFHNGCIKLEANIPVNRPTNFSDNAGNTFTPSNNKTLTYPYVRLKVSNNSGTDFNYKFEDFTVPSNAFGLVGTRGINPQVLLYPKKYEKVEEYYDKGILLNNFPVPVYTGSQFSRWLEQNKGNIVSSGITTAISAIHDMTPRITGSSISQTLNSGMGLGIGSLGFGAYGYQNEETTLRATAREGQLPVGSINNVIKGIGNLYDLMQKPPTAEGQINSDTLNSGINRIKFSFYSQTIKKEIAETVDDFFTMFGYATKRVKIPNIFANNSRHRRTFNYLKTSSCLIKPKTGQGLPADDIYRIEEILDKGITFWRDIQEVGNYSLANDIIT